MDWKKVIKKGIKKADLKWKLWSRYRFINRAKGYKNACFILAGYRPYLWKATLGRMKAYTPEHVDVCLVLSGVESSELEKIAKENGWSYLSTKRNQLCIAQNIAFSLFNKAEYIMKLDEDMFVTKGYFQKMKETYQKVKKSGPYDVGFVSPLIPVNTYGYIHLLKKYGKLEDYEKRFGKAYFGGAGNGIFSSSPEVPFFMAQIDELRDIDRLSEQLGSEAFSYSVCPVRYNIGAIYFRRQLWKDMGMFTVPAGGCGLGVDEDDINAYCICHSKAMVISENCAVAHFAYGAQVTERLVEYYKKHESRYLVKG